MATNRRVHSPPTDRAGDRGLTLTRQAPAAAIATVDAAAPPSEVWAELASTRAFGEALVEAALDAATGRTATEYLDALEAAGVDALHGAFRSLLARTAAGDERAMWDLLRETRRLGRGRSPLEDVKSPARVLALADAPTPTVAVRVGPGFRDRRPEQRRATCELLAELARGCDVRLVATGLTQRWLLEAHREDVPVSREDVTTPGAGVLADRVERARTELAADGREVALLRDLADESSGTLPYAALYAEHAVDRSRIRQCIGRLADLDLVGTFDGADGKAVELLPAGRQLVEDLDADLGRQAALIAGGDGDEDGVSETRQSCSQYTCSPTAHGTSPPEDRNGGGLAGSAFLSRADTATLAGAAAEGDVILVDRPIERAEDAREYGAWYEADARRLYVSLEYRAAHQWWVTAARALVEQLGVALPPEDLEELVLDEYPLAILRDARNLGCLKADMDGAEYTEALRDELERVIDLAGKWSRGEYDDGSRFYGELLRASKGLTYTLVHLLDLAGVETVLEARVPEHVRRDPEACDHLLETVVHGVAIGATYGEFAAYRQLYEDREGKREAALSPSVDATDPIGEPVATVVLSGPRIDVLEDELADGLAAPRPLHDEAPEFQVRATVGTPSRTAYATAVRAMCRAKNLDATREAIGVLEALTADVHAAATALNALATEDVPERIRLDEVRYALATLPADRLLPDAAPTVRKCVRALLGAEGSLSRTELAEAADVSTRSVDRHAARLEAFDLVRGTSDGYRLALNHRDERHRDVLPWYATPNRERPDARDATVKGVLFEAGLELDVDGAEAVREAVARASTLQLPPDAREDVLEVWGWAEPLLEAAEALAADELEYRHPRTSAVTFGAELEQAPLEAAPSTGGRTAT